MTSLPIINEEELFKAIRIIAGRGLSGDEVNIIHKAVRAPYVPVPLVTPVVARNVLTVRGVIELMSHEAVVREWYKDSVGVGTWAVGVTDASGHKVLRYKDNPQTLERCLEVSVWLMRNKYLPDVLKEFKGFELKEHELAAALSFHYNTGKIAVADWCDLWKAGKVAEARIAFMNWRSPPEIVERREKERDLFFDGVWSNDGTITEWKVKKPSYRPDWGSGRKLKIDHIVQKLMETK